MERNAEAEKTGLEDRAGLAIALRAGTESARRFLFIERSELTEGKGGR
jgi:hypothetical protein